MHTKILEKSDSYRTSCKKYHYVRHGLLLKLLKGEIRAHEKEDNLQKKKKKIMESCRNIVTQT